MTWLCAISGAMCASTWEDAQSQGYRSSRAMYAPWCQNTGAHQLAAVDLPMRHLLALRPAGCHRLRRLNLSACTHTQLRHAHIGQVIFQTCAWVQALTLSSRLMPGTMHDQQRVISRFWMSCMAPFHNPVRTLHHACIECAVLYAGSAQNAHLKVAEEGCPSGGLVVGCCLRPQQPRKPPCRLPSTDEVAGLLKGSSLRTHSLESGLTATEWPMQAHDYHGGMQGRMPAVGKMLSEDNPCLLRGHDMHCAA